MTKRNDADGWKRGAMGIDGDDSAWMPKQFDRDATDAIYGRGYHIEFRKRDWAKLDCDYNDRVAAKTAKV